MRAQLSRRGWWAATGMIACLMLHPASGLRASVVVPMSLRQLVVAADIVVDATVDDVRDVEGPDGIERLVRLRVLSTWKGDPEVAVHVRLPGGRLGRTETRVTGVPTPESGDRLVWFLVAHRRGGYSVVGLHQGALGVVTGPDGRARVLAPVSLAGKRGDVARVPWLLDDLADEVRGLAGSGAHR